MIQLVFAHGVTGQFGLRDGFPWGHIPQDLKNFQARTRGTRLVMGANTFASLPGLLPGREHIVVCDPNRPTPVTKDGSEPHSRIPILNESFLELWRSDKLSTYSIIGGPALLEKALPYASIVYSTKIEGNFKECDTWLEAEFIANLRDMYIPESHSYQINENLRIVEVVRVPNKGGV